MPSEDTIVAISTPPGRGGLGVVRLSGPRAIEISSQLLQVPQLETQRATVGTFCERPSGRVLDQVVVTCFRAPHSYTGEDVVEVSCHGAPVILRHFEACCVAQGARLAEPGEFTLRAFLKGRIDLTQAEAVRDLIDSQTLYQARVAAQQLEGSLSKRLRPQKQTLVELIARLEAGVDFAEDDVSVIEWQEIERRLAQIIADLEKLAAGYAYGRVVREGLTLAIIGLPNVGKSSLFNCLLNQERAIVTPVPGTTRDLVAETANLNGIPLRLVDTAGVRETIDEVEKLGVERTLSAIADSDLRLLVIDASAPWTEENLTLLEKLRPLGALLIALNKSDLPAPVAPYEVAWIALGSNTGGGQPEVVATSALTGAGIPELQGKLFALAAPARDIGPEGEFITNGRHLQLIQQSLASLSKARQAAVEQVHHELLLLDLYDGLRPLDLITGATYADDVLDVIFKTFCVGK